MFLVHIYSTVIKSLIVVALETHHTRHRTIVVFLIFEVFNRLKML